MKILNFFLLLWVIFALVDPDSEYGSGSTDLIESGFETMKVTPIESGSETMKLTVYASCFFWLARGYFSKNMARPCTLDREGGNPDFDGKRPRKTMMRKTVDYNSSFLNMLQNRVWQRDHRDRSVRPFIVR
jgi:hypothetical protein